MSAGSLSCIRIKALHTINIFFYKWDRDSLLNIGKIHVSTDGTFVFRWEFSHFRSFLEKKSLHMLDH
jgi:hypothetical protein